MNVPSDVVERLVEEASCAELGDERRTDRLGRIVAKLARAPSASLPSALGTDAEVQAAYRFMNNEDVFFYDVLSPHIQAAIGRATSAHTVLVLHDTTYCEFPSVDAEELGYLNTGVA